MKRTPIETPVGKISGRSAIHLDGVAQTVGPCNLRLTGELSSLCCSEYTGEARWIGYEANFKIVLAYQCCELEVYKTEGDIESSFDLVPLSDWAESLGTSKSYSHFVLATYDHVYEILACDFQFTLGHERGKKRKST
jgi:hypothetical protein